MGAGYSIRAKADQSAEIYIYEDVGEGWFGGVSAKQFAADLKALGSVATIDLHINSYGGEVFDGLAIHRQLVEHPAKVVAHIDGIAASIASVIAMAGDEIHIAEAGMMMIHPAQGGVLGDAAAMREMADILDKITAAIAGVYVNRTGADAAKVDAWIAASTWFSAEEAVANGFADEIEANMRLAARVDAKAHQAQFAEGQAKMRQALRPAARELAILKDAAVLVGAMPAPETAASVITADRPRLAAAVDRVARMRARATLAA